MNTDPVIESRAAANPVRGRILAMLERAGSWCSGEALSACLGISRAAVGKHVAALRAEGHAIEAATRRGYRLLVRRDVIDASVVASHLHTGVLGKGEWRMLEETTSTNLEAARLAVEGAAEGCVVLAERQTLGRGRKRDDWISVPRGLQFSVVLRPRARYWDPAALTGLGALAVARAVKGVTGIPAAFKPPNDVLVNGKKLAGVLVETGYRLDEPEWAVLGIGCNVNALAEDFPVGDRDRFTSVLLEAGRAISRAALLQAVLETLEVLYNDMQRGETPDFSKE